MRVHLVNLTQAGPPASQRPVGTPPQAPLYRGRRGHSMAVLDPKPSRHEEQAYTLEKGRSGEVRAIGPHALRVRRWSGAYVCGCQVPIFHGSHQNPGLGDEETRCGQRQLRLRPLGIVVFFSFLNSRSKRLADLLSRPAFLAVQLAFVHRSSLIPRLIVRAARRSGRPSRKSRSRWASAYAQSTGLAQNGAVCEL